MNSTACTGDYLFNCKNAKHCFVGIRVEDSKYFERGDTIRTSYDCLSGGEQELCYDSINPDNSYKAVFTAYCHRDREVWYSDSCQSSNDLFGCVGVKKGQYCILNKQYSEHEYRTLKSRLIEHMQRTGEWGEFFPAHLSPFCYNESVVQDEFPITKGEAAAAGFAWQDSLTKTEHQETITDIPDSINDVDDTILNEVCRCMRCGRNYKVIEQELRFYTANQIPIPRECFYCRLATLYRERGPIRLWSRSCQCAGAKRSPSTSSGFTYENATAHFHGDSACPNRFETTYAPERPEIVYCEQCYQVEIS